MSRPTARSVGVAMAAVIALSCGCSETETSPSSVSPEPDGPIAFRDVALDWGGAYSRGGDPLSEPTLFVIRDEAAWTELWNRIYNSYWPTPPRPAVDFAVETVLAVVDVERPYVWRLEVTDVTVDDGRLAVAADLLEYCWLPATSEPFHIVAIERFDWSEAALGATHVDAGGCWKSPSKPPN